MALIKIDFFSQALMRTVTVNAVVPTDKFIPGTQGGRKEFKTLYLLHGIFGNYTDWVTGTRIQSWAQEKDLVVIMPSGENKFYVDNAKSGDNYGKFIGEELVDFTRKTFPLSSKREDTFIGGLSMGGYGALRNGLKYSDVFGSIVALSSALVLKGVLNSQYKEDWGIDNRYYFETVFGDIDKLEGSDMDYNALAENIVKSGRTFPKLYLACGTEDFLIDANREYHKLLEKLEVKHTYVEGPGVHDWYFWDEYIKKALNWLPLDGGAQGINSGNVS